MLHTDSKKGRFSARTWQQVGYWICRVSGFLEGKYWLPRPIPNMRDRYWRRDHLVGRRPVPSLVEAIGYVGPAADLAAAHLSGSGWERSPRGADEDDISWTPAGQTVLGTCSHHCVSSPQPLTPLQLLSAFYRGEFLERCPNYTARK